MDLICLCFEIGEPPVRGQVKSKLIEFQGIFGGIFGDFEAVP